MKTIEDIESFLQELWTKYYENNEHSFLLSPFIIQGDLTLLLGSHQESPKILLSEELSDQQIYNRYLVCHTHFEKSYHLDGSLRGLTVKAVPTLGIPSVHDVLNNQSNPVSKIEVPQPEKSDIVMETTTEIGLNNTFDDSLYDQPSTSKTNMLQKPVLQHHELQSCSEPSSHAYDIHFHDYCREEPVIALKKIEKKRNSSVKGYSVLKKLNYTRKNQLSSKEQMLYNIICKLKKQLNQNKFQLKSYQERCTCGSKKNEQDEGEVVHPGV